MDQIFEVELRMYQRGAIRPVVVDSFTLRDDVEFNLGVIFAMGQNPIQSVAGCCSVSMGDVIRYGDDRYLVLALGFKKLEPGECTEQLIDPKDIARGGVSSFWSISKRKETMIELTITLKQDEGERTGISCQARGRHMEGGATEFEAEFADKLLLAIAEKANEIAQSFGPCEMVERVPFTTIKRVIDDEIPNPPRR